VYRGTKAEFGGYTELDPVGIEGVCFGVSYTGCDIGGITVLTGGEVVSCGRIGIVESGCGCLDGVTVTEGIHLFGVVTTAVVGW